MTLLSKGHETTELLNPSKERFLRKVTKGSPEQCWQWSGTVGRGGYGLFTVRGPSGGWLQLSAHRIAWVLSSGCRIPPGLTIDHKCRNRLCQNPAHMEVVTISENARRANPYRSVCRRGHNDFRMCNDGRRRCRTCATQRELQRLKRRVETTNPCAACGGSGRVPK